MPSLRDMPIEELLKALEATRRDAPGSDSVRILERELKRREAVLRAIELDAKGGSQ